MTSEQQLTDDALNRRAAELMGWTDINRPGDYGMMPNKRGRRPIPQPATDYGDALRFAAFTLRTPPHMIDIDYDKGFSDGDYMARVCGCSHCADTLPLAITRACVAALEAAREEVAK